MTYDLDNRISKAKVGNQAVNYRYDALGRRVARKEGSTKTALIWWGNSECAEHKHRAGQTVIQNDIMSHPMRLNAVIARAKQGDKNKLQWYHKNYLDHVYALSNKRGKLIEHYRYSAFGEIEIFDHRGRKQGQSQINNQITWNTRRLDTLTGYYLYKYRHYDPQLGRWPSRDPIEEKGGINLYAFVGNSPVGRWDRLGLQKVKQGDALDIKFNANKIGTATITKYIKHSNATQRGANIVIDVNITDPKKECGNDIFRWRQHFSIKDNNGDFLKWLNKDADNILDPDPNDDDKDWYWTNGEWNQKKSADGRSAQFSDVPTKNLTRLQGKTTKVIQTFKLELVKVKDLTVKAGGTVVLTVEWGFSYTKNTHEIIER